ncbi:hypothetical protein M514_24109 [Trichuris suis]|uniref:Uncharacterized protein n=1 Tax=Trichuris suis TaxID=68888 RepID=A0A085N2R0_9BILA|nr:hypothetical protein M514_24109 [Trichuris suis]
MFWFRTCMKIVFHWLYFLAPSLFILLFIGETTGETVGTVLTDSVLSSLCDVRLVQCTCNLNSIRHARAPLEALGDLGGSAGNEGSGIILNQYLCYEFSTTYVCRLWKCYNKRTGVSHLAESRLADRSYGRQSFGRLVVWPTGRMADRSYGRQVVWLTGRLADRSFGRLVVWPTGRLVDWSFGRLVFWTTGRLADRSFGRHVTFLERIKAQDE